MAENSNAMPFAVDQKPFKIGNFSTIYELKQNPDYVVKEYKSTGLIYKEENRFAFPPEVITEHRGKVCVVVLDEFEGQTLTTSGWAARAKEQVGFTGPNTIFAHHTPLTHVVAGGSERSPTIYLVTKKVEGNELNPNNPDFLQHVKQFGEFIDLTLASVQAQLRTSVQFAEFSNLTLALVQAQLRTQYVRVPDIFTFDEYDYITPSVALEFRFNNFSYGSIDGGEARLYLTDVYPLRYFFKPNSVPSLEKSYKNAVNSLDTVLSKQRSGVQDQGKYDEWFRQRVSLLRRVREVFSDYYKSENWLKPKLSL